MAQATGDGEAGVPRSGVNPEEQRLRSGAEVPLLKSPAGQWVGLLRR